MIGFETDKVINDSLQGLTDLLAQQPLGISLFFNYFNGRNCCMTSLFSTEMFNFETPDAFIEYLKGCSLKKLKTEMLTYYDCFRHSASFYGELFVDRKKLTEYLAGIRELHGLRLELIRFFEDPGPVLENIIRILTLAKPMVEQIHRVKSQQIEMMAEQWNEKCNNPVLTFRGDIDDIKISTKSLSRIMFSVSVVNPYVCYILRKRAGLYLCLGLDYENARSANTGLCEYVDLFSVAKALGDELRFEVFELLNSRDMYLTEIAAAFSLPPPAISYHINCLVNARLITIRTQGRRIYYSVNRCYLNYVARFIKAVYGKN